MVDRRLGRGLDFFLSGGRKSANPKATTPLRDKVAPDALAAVEEAGEHVRMIPVGQLKPNPYQPRRDMDEAELKTLAESIRTSGILQPILARQVGKTFEIVAGERRWRAAQLAKLTEVPVLCRELSDNDSAVFALVENLQREDLNAIEKARGIRLLMDQMKATQEQVAKQVGLERSTVANFLRLLDLPASIQAYVSRGTLSMGHARTLLALPDHKIMEKTADQAIKQGMSVRATEARVKELLVAIAGGPELGQKGAKATKKKARPVWLNELEENLIEVLGTPVAIKYGRKRSQIVIACSSQKELDRIFTRLKNS